MENIKSEETGQKPTKVITTFKDTISKLDANAPQIEKIDYSIMNRVLSYTDFTNTKNTFDALKLFYERMWAEVIFKLEDQIYAKDREIGRLIIQAFEAEAARKKAENEADTLRKELQN